MRLAADAQLTSILSATVDKFIAVEVDGRHVVCRESLAIRAAALEETLAETRAERGQLENYKQLARESEAAKVWPHYGG